MLLADGDGVVEFIDGMSLAGCDDVLANPADTDSTF